MKLTDLKIGTQLKIGFGIIVLLIFVLGVNSWWQAGKLAQQTTDLHEHPFTVRSALGELKADVLFMQRGMKDLGLIDNNSELIPILQGIDNYKVIAENQFDILYDSYLGPRTDIDIAYKDFIEWNTIRDETMRLMREGKVKEAMARTKSSGAGGLQVEILLGHLLVIDNFAKNKAEQFFKNNIELRNSLNLQLILLVAFILALTILITYLLNTNIRRPIAELANVTQLFREGNTEVRSTYQSPNEFGQLSSSFNDLAETIETELTLNKKASKIAGAMLSEDDAHRFCHVLLNVLLENSGSQMGAVYLLNDAKTEFEHFECIGMNSEGCKPFSAIHFEGEFGSALASKKLQYITNIPDDTRFTFSTVSGKFTPREIITIPLVTGNVTVAVISLATIKSFSKNSLRLINTLLNTLNARMDGILTYRKVIAFSNQLEIQNNELEAQKRELNAQANELTEQNIELEMQKNHLDQANRMKTSFLSNMSHELRTPLNSVIALSGVLNRRLEGKVPGEEHSYIEVIERNGKQLLSLINDILDLSRIEAGYEEIEIRKFSANELINEVVELIEPQSIQKNIHLHYVVEENLPDIHCDYEKCRHILQNLVANAVKFTEVGEVEVTAEANTETIHIIVNDTGIGIDKEHLPHIFDEFRQADGSNSRKYGGTGLGLAIAKKYAEMLGGNITVESTRGKGSKFSLNLPLQNTNTKITKNVFNQPATDKTEYHTGLVNPSEKTILLVEDTEAMIVQMKDMLESQGYNIMVAHNGSEALEQIDVKIPDAMLLDLMMPEVDGFEVLKRVREVEKTNHLPVIILTAKYITKEELGFLKSNGIIQLIRKGDINKDQMLKAVAGMMFSEVKEIITPAKKLARISTLDTPVVLIVEDNPDNMLTIKALLDGKVTVIEAEDGATAIELAIIHQPHLILMDIALPGINGIEVLGELRKLETLKHVPVIAVSASAMKGDREDFIACGFDGYISKPIDSIAFERTIKEFLE
jgi:signal transduction histidine kinase/CheY-like chemotaxis protein/HAMP domain-containing protein